MSLDQWAVKDRRGKSFGSSVQFMLPDGSGLSPDAAWASTERLSSVSKRELRQFPHLAPEFVIEVMSPSDRLSAARKKMRLWASNGVEPGWLIDGDNCCVFVYRGTAEPRVVTDTESEAREALGLKSGDKLFIAVRGKSMVVLPRPRSWAKPLRGLAHKPYHEDYLDHERSSWD